MTKQTIAPYGTWVSPVTPQLMTEAAIGLAALSVDGDDLYWLESRPAEAGRSALCRRQQDGTIADVTPQPIDVGSRVHEYGGGAYAVKNGVVIFSERRDGSLWLIEGGAPPRRIATPDGCRYADFSFDPARKRIIAIREDHRDRPPNDPKAGIVALPLNGGAEAVLFEGPDFLSSPRLSPDGKTLAFIAWDHPNMPWDGTQLYCAGVIGDGRLDAARLIAGEAEEAIVQPRFAADGTLYFSSDRSGWWNLYALRNGRIEAVAPIEAEIGGPHWIFGQRSYELLDDGRILAAVVRQGLREVAIIKNGHYEWLDCDQVLDCPFPLGARLAMVATPANAPPAVILKEPGRRAITVRAGTPPFLAPESISTGTPITFPTQDTIGHAFWYPPKNRDYAAPDGELPPLVVLSHGGPTSMTTNGYGLRIQWWTTRGFAVVDVNYGGSTGFGRSYRQRLDGEWGIVDVADCIAAARYLADQGLVDRNRIVIRGGSAGGFTTLAALTLSNVFKAGASLYGVADLKLLARDTHKFESRYLDRLIGPLPQADALYEERSPINHLDRLACPIIFFQGLDDKTVPPNQAEEMVAAMKARQLPVAYYAFEGEGHGFRKALTLKRVLELELDFYGRVFGFEVPQVSERVAIN
ncbi:MAG TPA: S9 family peptidase [Methylovirgula sp.]|nr:S9 family peptidase [Methylovirgula sp.]